MSLFQSLLGNNLITNAFRLTPAMVDESRSVAEKSLDEYRVFSERQFSETNVECSFPAYHHFIHACELVFGYAPKWNQLVAGHLMSNGAAVELDTGEGKTLAIAFGAFLLKLRGIRVHVPTSNHYLAARDFFRLKPLYDHLDMTVSCLHAETSTNTAEDYSTDVVYGACSTFIFDFLRDETATNPLERVQGPLHAVIIDEIDAVLLDEALTPVVLSSAKQSDHNILLAADRLASQMRENEHFNVSDEAGIFLSDAGVDFAEQYLRKCNILPFNHSLYDGKNNILSYVDAAFRARLCLRYGKDYIVSGQVLQVIDRNTGRVLHGRRYSHGIHEAVEVKEHLPITGSGEALNSISYLDYFRRYTLLSGASGTIQSSANEFRKLYNLPVFTVPPTQPKKRVDLPDQLFATQVERDCAVVHTAIEAHRAGRPVLIGTTSIEASERLAGLFSARGFELRDGASPQEGTFALLNASRMEKEDEVIERAGHQYALTIATNVAGRGTDIIIPPQEKASSLGLLVLGVERNFSRRLDDQLRGRSGRQGEHGTTQFFVSPDDELVQVFAQAEDLSAVTSIFFDRLQRVATAHFSDLRSNDLEYTLVDSWQRSWFQYFRNTLLEHDEFETYLRDTARQRITSALDHYINERLFPEEWDFAALSARFESYFGIQIPMALQNDLRQSDVHTVHKRLLDLLPEISLTGGTLTRTCLMAVDACWQLHLNRIGFLRQSVVFRTYGQMRPILEYTRDAHALFKRFIDEVEEGLVISAFTH